MSSVQHIADPPKGPSTRPFAWLRDIMAKSPPIASPLKTEAEAAAYLRISPSTLRRLRKMGEIECCKLKSRYRYSVEQLENYIKSVSGKSCDKSDFKSVSTGCPYAAEAPFTKPHGTKIAPDKRVVLRLAQKTFKKQK